MSHDLQTGNAAATQLPAQLHALLHTAGVAPLDNLGWIRVTGEDRVRWLNGMVTNSINNLKPGEGNYNFVLSAQGRIQGTAYAFAQSENLLLQTDRDQVAPLSATLDHFIIMDDVELTDISDTLTGIALIGPNAASLLASLDLPAPAPISLQTIAWQGADTTLVAAYSPLVPRFELWTAPETASTLLAALTEAGATPISSESIEWLRLLEGTPRYGTDIRDKELPQETAQPRALHFAKGCYLGQEIVERIRSRGAVHRTFAAFRLEGPLPAPGTPIEADGKPVGELTSSAAIPLASGTLQIALGYIRREVLDRDSTITCATGKAFPIALPVREP